jgi:hypothetical protein
VRLIVCNRCGKKSKHRDADNACQDCRRAYHRLRKYGLTQEQYDAMVKAQNGVCKICKQPETRVIRGQVPLLSVDHDHATGKVRGLLCYACNHALGLFKDSVKTMKRAIRYLEGSDK